MGSDDKMMMELLMQDKVVIAADQEHRMMVLTSMLRYREQLAVVPRRGGSRAVKAKNKNRQ
jgi:hypothetical protein